MTTLIERTLRTQREQLKLAHNERFTKGEYEFRLIYEGGLAESFAILARKQGERNFNYFDGFSAYKFYTTEQVLAFAKAQASQRLGL